MKISKMLRKFIFYALLLLTALPVKAIKLLQANDLSTSTTTTPKKLKPQPSPSAQPASLKATTKKKKRRRRKKKTDQITVKVPPKAPPIYTFETSPSKSADESFLRQETPNYIDIADPKNNAKIRLYKIAKTKEESTKWKALTIGAQEEELKTALLKAFKAMKPTYRVNIWFTNPIKELQNRETKLWRDIYNKQPEEVINPKVAADKQLQKYFGIIGKQIYDTKRPLTNQEDWTITSHNFAQEVDKYIPDYAVYSVGERRGLKPGEVSFIIPGELNKEPVAFTYTIAPKKIDGKVRHQLYHRFATKYPLDRRVERLLTDAWNSLRRTPYA